MSVRMQRKRKVTEDSSEQLPKRRPPPQGFPEEIPNPFRAIGYQRMDELELLDSYDSATDSDLPETLHPILEWSEERWLGIDELTHSRLLPALRLASYLLFQNSQVRAFFTRAWFAETTINGIQSLRDGESECLPQQLLLPLHTIPNASQAAERAMARMKQIAQYISFELGYGFSGTQSYADSIDTNYYSSSCAITTNETLPKVPESQHIRWLSHRNGCRVRIQLNDELLSFATSEKIRYWKGEVVQTYPAYCLRANLLVAMTLIHEIAHTVEFLRFMEMVPKDEKHFYTKDIDIYWDENEWQNKGINEWGFELESSLVGGGVLNSTTSAVPYMVGPLYGLLLSEIGWIKGKETSERYWLISMDWVQWWFSKSNIDLLNERGPAALPKVIDQYILIEEVEKGGICVPMFRLRDGEWKRKYEDTLTSAPAR
jgi:hypothetical protein